MQALKFPSLLRAAVPLAALAWLPVHAQATYDPTRPPPAVLNAQTPGAAEAAADGTVGGVSIVVRGAARKFVLVDGRVVRPGETYNGARLVAITESGVVWQKGNTRENASMTPAVVKTQVHQEEGRKPRAKPVKKTKNGESS